MPWMPGRGSDLVAPLAIMHMHLPTLCSLTLVIQEGELNEPTPLHNTVWHTLGKLSSLTKLELELREQVSLWVPPGFGVRVQFGGVGGRVEGIWLRAQFGVGGWGLSLIICSLGGSGVWVEGDVAVLCRAEYAC